MSSTSPSPIRSVQFNGSNSVSAIEGVDVINPMSAIQCVQVDDEPNLAVEEEEQYNDGDDRCDYGDSHNDHGIGDDNDDGNHCIARLEQKIADMDSADNDHSNSENRQRRRQQKRQ